MENLSEKQIEKLQNKFRTMKNRKKPNEKGFIDLTCEDVVLMEELENLDLLEPLTETNSMHTKFTNNEIFDAFLKLKANFFPEKFGVDSLAQKLALKFSLKNNKVIKEAKKYGKIEDIRKFNFIRIFEQNDVISDRQCYHNSFQIAKYLIAKEHKEPKILVGTITVSCPETTENTEAKKVSTMHAVVELNGKIFDYNFGIFADKAAYNKLFGFGVINEITAGEIMETERAVNKVFNSNFSKSKFHDYRYIAMANKDYMKRFHNTDFNKTKVNTTFSTQKNM